MYLDFFDKKILDVLTKKGQPLTLAELVKDSGSHVPQSSSIWSGLALKSSS